MPYIGNTIRAADDYRLIDDISSGFNGNDKTFALQVAGSAPVPFPKSPQQVLISVNGVIQEPDPTGTSGFNLSGTNIVFSSAPANGHAFFGIIYATADYLNAGGNFPAGSLGAPSITFIGDENSGLYRKSGGSVGFVSDATEIANFDSNGITISSGNLIIPDSIIHGGDSNTKIRFDQADHISFETAGSQRLVMSSGSLVINDISTDFDVRIEGGTDANLFFTDAGNNRVGIGSNSPTSKLFVNGVSTDHIITARASDTNGNSIVNILSEGTTGNSRILFSDTAANDGIITYSHTNRSLLFGTAGNVSDMMLLNSGGDLLLGTTADTILANFNANAGGVLLDDVNSGATVYGVTHGSRQLFLGCDTAHNYLWGYSNDALYIGTNNATRISILNNGRVGIGDAAISALTALHIENSSGDTYLKVKRASKSTGQTAVDIDGGTSGVRYIIHQPQNEDNLNFYITGINATKLIYGSDGRVGMGSSPGTGQQLLIGGNGLGITGQNVSHVANCVTIGEEGSGKAQIRCYGPDNSTFGKLEVLLSAADGSGNLGDITFERESNGANIKLPNGGGISFAATGDGGGTMASEILDDYEEGTWTPSTTGGTPQTVHGAHYVKSGDMVMAQAYVNMPSSSSTAIVQFTNLPYSVVGASHYSIGACYTAVTGSDHVFVQTNPGQASLNLYKNIGNSITYNTISQDYVLFTVVYRSA